MSNSARQTSFQSLGTSQLRKSSRCGSRSKKWPALLSSANHSEPQSAANSSAKPMNE
jgi:hypothetical protein